ncbi:hypothetical protein AB432_010385 [Brevibacillus brevis]|uniref:Uncharacterized protein n=1 Tax=Brevibacillus brevis TaxID=1393 RepID=A0A2Z4MFX8_BREBE|nr:hypothetical protein AB432_010385 [Brevibacillus brevis]
MKRVRFFCLGSLTYLIAGDASYFIFIQVSLLLNILYFTINEASFQYLLDPLNHPRACAKNMIPSSVRFIWLLDKQIEKYR